MRYLISACITLALTVTFAPRAGAERLAVLIGADSYDKMPRLRYCSADARELADTLIEHGDYKRHNVTVLSDDAYNQEYRPLGKSIRRVLTQVVDQARKEDTIVVFFAGHAVTADGKCHLVPTDGDAGNSVPLLWVTEQLERAKATQKLLVLDVSRAGTKSGDVAGIVSGMKLGDGLVVALASGKDQTSHVGTDVGHGAFAYCLMLGVSGEAADKNGKVNMKALQAHLIEGMKKLQEAAGVEQTPVFVGEAKEDFIVSYARSAIQGIIVTMRPGKGWGQDSSGCGPYEILLAPSPSIHDDPAHSCPHKPKSGIAISRRKLYHGTGLRARM